MENRNLCFNRAWNEIIVEIDGQLHAFAITQGFWNKCPEFRDRGSPVIRNWLQRHHSLEWSGKSLRFELKPLDGNRFQLLS